jgi:8-oxo-dGTP diphosphatase
MVDEWQPDEGSDYEPPLFLVAGGVFAERGGQILILKRAGGEMIGAWDIPSGIVESGETPEEGALRELREEAGLRPSGPVSLVGVTSMPLYGHEAFRLMYACPCEEGEVVLSDEHSGFRWIDPLEYRERYFSDELIVQLEASSARHGVIVRAVRRTLDEYLSARGRA